MTQKQINPDQGLETTFSIWKSSFLVILLACLISGLVTVGSQELSYRLFPSTDPDVLMERQVEKNKQAIDQGDIDVQWGLDMGSKLKAKVVNLTSLVGPLGGMVSAGLFVSVYKRVLDQRQVQTGDIFIFFKKNFLRNYLICFLMTLLSNILINLFLIPGIIFNLYMFFWPLILYKALDGEFSLSDFFKDSAAESKGEKGTIFAKTFKYGFIIFIVVFILSFAVLMATASSGPMEGGIGVGGLGVLGVGLLTVLVMAIIEPFIYLAYIEIFLERKKLVLERQRIQDQLMEDQAPQAQEENLDPEVEEEEKPHAKPYDQDIHSDFD